MALALSLVFEEEAVAGVRALWRSLADAGISRDMLELGYPPHLTLVVADDDGLEDAMRHALRAVEGRGVTIKLGGVRRFDGTPVVWLACEGGGALTSLHADIAALLPPQGIRPHYRPGQWTPHMTLQTTGDAAAAAALVEQLWQARPELRATHHELARFLPVQVLERVALADRPPTCPSSS